MKVMEIFIMMARDFGRHYRVMYVRHQLCICEQANH